MDDECTVTFTGTNGGTYYVACNLVEYLDEQLVNTGSSQIVLYPSIQSGNQQTNITIPALSYPYFSDGYNRVYITNASNVSFNFRSAFYRERSMVSIVLLAVVVSLSLISRLVKGGK